MDWSTRQEGGDQVSIRYEHGDVLSAPAEAVVNTVNTRGVMGKGIALQVRQRWPEVDRAYRAACRRGEVRLGKMHVAERGGLGDRPRFVINFPTKDHWRSRSRLADIQAGLEDLRDVISRLGITSIAVPPLGCGNGGLSWSDVRPLIETALRSLPGVEVLVYPPGAAPAASDMQIGTTRPTMSPTLAGLVRLLDGYWKDVLGITDIEVQKLAYFLGVRRPALQLRFDRGAYGPYCESLHHVLQRAEGHYLRGYGDRSRKPWEPGQLDLLAGAVEAANEAISMEPGMEGDVEAARTVVIGFEGAWGMELLSTVHWVATESGGATNAVEAHERIQHWSLRKNRLFPRRDVEDAWGHLSVQGWLSAPPPVATLFEG
jgi:O-acetyl-ADP-ribose deacetylase (regulator of RNase III)